ncbi:hypothetical protein N0V85_009658 [Neurospora sp. IMI 360204]|nr:hypothetical protein N0V85_009658 [Neurospora sp. IMI 360204]
MKYIPKPDPEPQQQSPPPPSPLAAATAAPVKPPSPPRARVSPKLQPQAQPKPSVVAPSPPPPITTTSIPIRTTTSNTSPIAKSPVRVSPSAKHELIRYTKIVRRLKWKLPFLASGYALALKGRDPKHGDAVISGGVLNEGEIMFKLDFFEYYMLIERALVHLLGVFGITRAKDLRNRWKTADSEAEEKERVKLTAPLESYDVEKMLKTIFQGFDAAFLISEWHVRDKEGGLEKRAQSSLSWADDDDATMMDWEAQEADQWEFMVDARDWEAV